MRGWVFAYLRAYDRYGSVVYASSVKAENERIAVDSMLMEFSWQKTNAVRVLIDISLPAINEVK